MTDINASVNVHNYKALTGEYISTSVARIDPLEGTPLVPANATLIALPVDSRGLVLCFIGGVWELLEDNRGIAYHRATRRAEAVSQLGDLSAELTSLVPPEGGIWDAVNGVWGENLEVVKLGIVADLKAQTSALIQGGITSDALGAVHEYPTGTTDQMNLTAVILANNATVFWCKDGGDNWARRPHTAEQIARVGADVMAGIVTYQGDYEDALVAVEASVTVVEARAVTL